MEIEIQIINAFIDGESGGNPAGVVLDADEFSARQKSKIAAKIGLSEIAFVSSSKSADFKLDFYTPTRQIAHCGHATIATFSYLQQLGRIKKADPSKETIDGNRNIFIDGDMAFMEQLAPSYKEIDHRMDSLISSLGISVRDLLSNYKPFIVNTGNSFLVVPLKDETAVLSAHPDFGAIHKISEEFDLIGYYISHEVPEYIDIDQSHLRYGHFGYHCSLRLMNLRALFDDKILCFSYVMRILVILVN